MPMLRLLDSDYNITLVDSSDLYAEYKTLYKGRLGDLKYEDFVEWEEMYYVTFLHIEPDHTIIHLDHL